MCGIAGACWSPAHDTLRVEEQLTVSIAAMHNRGPDSAGQELWRSPDGWLAALGSTRLAVLDLSPAGSQPMTSPDGRFTIVYNGEITNYIEVRRDLAAAGETFASNGDTEVLLRGWKAWGPACVDRLEGMYAFAVLDRAEMTMTLCRDPFGIKPLFYRFLPGTGLAFGSEVASLLPLLPGRPSLDWGTAVAFLASGTYDDSSATFLDGVRQLPPGCSITVSLSTGDVQEHPPRWRPSIATDPSMTPRQAVEGVRALLLQSVRRNLRSDVPVGIALSGGIDSSALACMVRALEPDYPLRAFSFVSSDTATDESAWVSVVRDRVGGELWTVSPTAGDLAQDLDDLILAQGEPFGSTSIYAQYRVFRLMHEAGIVVSLDGQGGDEVFAGYHGYVGQRVRSQIETGNVVGAAAFLRAWSRWPGRRLWAGAARAGAEWVPAGAVSVAYRRLPGTVPPGVDMDALRDRGLGWDWPVRNAEHDGHRGVRVKAELRASLTQRGLQALLRHGDRNSMRFSVESRVPFLDRELVDFVLSLPETMLVDARGTSKSVLRAAMRGMVPDAIVDRRDKVGFETPEADWIGSRRSAFAGAISEAPRVGFLDTSSVVRGVVGDGQPPTSARLTWRLFNLYRWMALLGVDGRE